MAIRDEAILQLRTFTAGRLSSHAFRRWFEASEARFAEIDPCDEVLRLLAEARATLDHYDGFALREHLSEQLVSLDLHHLLELARPTPSGGRTA